MAQLKPNPERYQSLLSRRAFLNKQLERCQLFDDGSKTKFWKEIKSMAFDKLRSIDNTLDEYDKKNPSELIQLLEARRQFKYFMNFVDDFANSAEQFNQEITKLNKDIEEYSLKLSRHGS